MGAVQGGGMSVQVPKGYKQTEVGVIPEDWNLKTFGQVLSICHGKSQREVEVEDGPYPILASGGKIGTAKLPLYEYDSVLIGRKGTINKPQFMSSPFWTVDTLFYSRINSGNCAKFIYYLFCSIDWMQHNEASGVPSLNARTIEAIQRGYPLNPEQQAIAEALSDADALIESLEQLIAKKRQIKQGAMQELLTGQRRLPGFSGEWVRRRLGEICSMKSGFSITSDDIDDFSEYPCYGGNGLRGYTSKKTHSGKYALIGRQGALCGNVVLFDGDFFASEHAIVVTPSHNLDIAWFSYILERMNLNQYSESSAQPGLSVSKLLLLEEKFPPKDEQIEIANFLLAIEEEIQSLVNRLNKARQIKQSMMQELLTGRIRLI